VICRTWVSWGRTPASEQGATARTFSVSCSTGGAGPAGALGFLGEAFDLLDFPGDAEVEARAAAGCSTAARRPLEKKPASDDWPLMSSGAFFCLGGMRLPLRGQEQGRGAANG
jgi:hypothetical protein